MKKIQDIFNSAMNAYRYEKGIREIEKILRLGNAGRTEDILSKLGALYDHFALQQESKKQKKNYEEKAIQHYREALRINPNSYRAFWGMGRVWWHRRSKKAIPYAQKAYRLRKKIEGTTGLYAQNIGLIYEALGDFQRAEYWLLRGKEENKKDYGSYLNLVVFYRYIKNFKKAQYYAKPLKVLYEKESPDFKKTPWGKKIREVIINADKPLAIKKK